MRHYYSPSYRQVAGAVTPESDPSAPGARHRERIPTLIDALDCLLALWVAEATLDLSAQVERASPRVDAGAGSTVSRG